MYYGAGKSPPGVLDFYGCVKCGLHQTGALADVQAEDTVSFITRRIKAKNTKHTWHGGFWSLKKINS